MANHNYKFFVDAVNQNNLQGVQLLADKSGVCCTTLIYKGNKFKTGSMNKQACYDLVNQLACSGNVRIPKNQVQFTGSNKCVYINGNKYSVLEVLNGVSVKSLFDILEDNKGSKLYYTIGEWLEDWSNRYNYVKTIDSDEYAILMNMAHIEYYLSTGERVANCLDLVTALDKVATEWARAEGVELTEAELVGV